MKLWKDMSSEEINAEIRRREWAMFIGGMITAFVLFMFFWEPACSWFSNSMDFPYPYP